MFEIGDHVCDFLESLRVLPINLILYFNRYRIIFLPQTINENTLYESLEIVEVSPNRYVISHRMIFIFSSEQI